MNIRDISIRNKLILMQVFTSVVVLGIFVTVFVVTDIRDYKQRKVNSLLSLSQVIGTNSISTLEFQDNEAAKEILTELKKVLPEIIYATILDKEGKVFAYYARQESDTILLSNNLLEKRQVEFSDNELFVKTNIINSNKIIGKVIINIQLTELNSIKKTRYKLAGICLLIAIGFSFLISLVVQPYISKRLLGLVNTMENLSITQDYNTPITDDGKDEISVLIKVFNDLMFKISINQQKKDEFIGIASHELKTPLTSIKGYLEILEMMETQQPNKQYVEKAIYNINRLERLIKDLLDVSKIQSGQLQLNITNFDITELITETIAAIQIVSKHKVDREDNLSGIIIPADRQRIEQVLVNLLSNAIKYSPGEDSIVVTCKKTSTEFIVQIRDFGRGILPEEHQNIFNRFYRTKDSSINISGFGLGLYICKDIINRHHGKIWVESENKGSSFYFSLPLLQQ